MYSSYCNKRKEERWETETSYFPQEVSKNQNKTNKQQTKPEERETKIKGKINEIGK